MASIRKSTKSRNWIACYTDETGKQRQRSTGETDRRKALRMAFDYEEGYRKMKTEAQARRVLSDIYEQVHGENLQSASMVNFFATWLLQKRNEVTPGTFDRYENAIKGFIGFLGIRVSGSSLFCGCRTLWITEPSRRLKAPLQRPISI